MIFLGKAREDLFEGVKASPRTLTELFPQVMAAPPFRDAAGNTSFSTKFQATNAVKRRIGENLERGYGPHFPDSWGEDKTWFGEVTPAMKKRVPTKEEVNQLKKSPFLHLLMGQVLDQHQSEVNYGLKRARQAEDTLRTLVTKTVSTSRRHRSHLQALLAMREELPQLLENIDTVIDKSVDLGIFYYGIQHPEKRRNDDALKNSLTAQCTPLLAIPAQVYELDYVFGSASYTGHELTEHASSFFIPALRQWIQRIREVDTTTYVREAQITAPPVKEGASRRGMNAPGKSPFHNQVRSITPRIHRMFTDKQMTEFIDEAETRAWRDDYLSHLSNGQLGLLTNPENHPLFLEADKDEFATLMSATVKEALLQGQTFHPRTKFLKWHGLLTSLPNVIKSKERRGALDLYLSKQIGIDDYVELQQIEDPTIAQEATVLFGRNHQKAGRFLLGTQPSSPEEVSALTNYARKFSHYERLLRVRHLNERLERMMERAGIATSSLNDVSDKGKAAVAFFELRPSLRRSSLLLNKLEHLAAQTENEAALRRLAEVGNFLPVVEYFTGLHKRDTAMYETVLRSTEDIDPELAVSLLRGDAEGFATFSYYATQENIAAFFKNIQGCDVTNQRHVRNARRALQEARKADEEQVFAFLEEQLGKDAFLALRPNLTDGVKETLQALRSAERYKDYCDASILEPLCLAAATDQQKLTRFLLHQVYRGTAPTTVKTFTELYQNDEDLLALPPDEPYAMSHTFSTSDPNLEAFLSPYNRDVPTVQTILESLPRLTMYRGQKGMFALYVQEQGHPRSQVFNELAWLVRQEILLEPRQRIYQPNVPEKVPEPFKPYVKAAI